MIIAKKHELIRRMAHMGFSGIGLARASQLSQSYISQIISGKRSVLAPTARKMCAVLQCDFGDVFMLKGEVHP
jgi:transcriptional regulator with XRE-family HTH domain